MMFFFSYTREKTNFSSLLDGETELQVTELMHYATPVVQKQLDFYKEISPHHCQIKTGIPPCNYDTYIKKNFF